MPHIFMSCVDGEFYILKVYTNDKTPWKGLVWETTIPMYNTRRDWLCIKQFFRYNLTVFIEVVLYLRV